MATAVRASTSIAPAGERVYMGWLWQRCVYLRKDRLVGCTKNWPNTVARQSGGSMRHMRGTWSGSGISSGPATD